MVIKLKTANKYDLHYDEGTRCFRLLEWNKHSYSNSEGYCLLYIPKDELIDLIAEHASPK